MATLNGIRRLRFFKIPLLLVMLASGCLIMRVPVIAMTTGGDKVAQAEKKKRKKPKQAKKQNKDRSANQQIVAAETPNEATLPDTPQDTLPEDTLPSLSLPSDPLAEAGAALGEQARHLAAIPQLIPRLVGGETDSSPQVPTPANGNATDESVPTDAIPPATSVEIPVREPSEPVEIVIRNPADSGGPIRFLVDARKETLAPGAELRLPVGADYRLRFHRGARFGVADETLSKAGEYLLVPTSQGWTLQRN